MARGGQGGQGWKFWQFWRWHIHSWAQHCGWRYCVVQFCGICGKRRTGWTFD